LTSRARSSAAPGGSGSKPQSVGTIGPDLVVHGRLSGKSDLRIDGVFDGELSVEGEVWVGPDGSVSAPVAVGSLEIEGEVRGDVTAHGAVAIRPGGRLLGDVRARRICIDDGGSLQGGIEMEFELPEERE
jgi:cytoskeletal protein CcmA (bactofilin family)